MAITGEGIALVIGAIGAFIVGPVVTVWTRIDARRDAEKKEELANVERLAARAAQRARDEEIKAGQESIHSLVDGHNSALTGEVVALKDVISKGMTPPSMLAADAAPAQVTQDGGVISVGKEKEP